MSAFKHKRTGRWVAQVSQDGRKKQIGTFDTLREAKAAIRSHEEAVPAGETTVQAWRERWLQTPTWKESTRINHEDCTRPFANEYGTMRLAALTRAQARDWVLARPSQHNSLSAMFGAAVYADLLPVNPFVRLVHRKTRKRDLRPDWLTEADILTLERAAVQAHGPVFGRSMAGMIRFASETGLRPGELYVIRDCDLDVANSALYVRRAASTRGKTITTPKTGVEREVVLSRRAVLAAQSALRYPAVDRIFSTVTGQQFWSASFTWAWKPIKAVAGRPDMHFYELRHYCATRLLEAGMSDADVAIQLGHTDGGELVRRVYGHPTDRAARERIRRTLNNDEERAA